MTDTADTAAEPDVMAMAMAADNAPAPEASPSPEQTDTVQTDAQVSSETTADNAQDPQRTEPTQNKAPDQKPESAFKRAQRDQARLAENWKKFEQEKTQLRAEREQIMRERDEFRRHQEQAKTRRSENDPTPEDYESLAAKYEREGQDDYALAARAKARQLRAEMQPTAQQQEAWRTPEFQSKWQENVNRLQAENPALREANNPVISTTNNLINDPNYGRFFRAHPDGIRAAYEVAQILHNAQTATLQLKGMQQELAKQKAENQRLTKLTAIGGSHPAPGTVAQTKQAALLTDDEAMAMAERADANSSW
jgi:DNA repair exonuclease SbcCD ATPase subunit